MTRKLLTALAFGALMAFVPGCPKEQGGGGSSGGDTIKIAMAGPITGPAGALGRESQQGAELAIEQCNAAGGIAGKKLELVVEDDKGNANEATNVAKKIASNPQIPIVIGHFNSSCTKAARETYNREGIVEFSAASTDITVCRDYPYTFRNLYHDGYQGVFIARYVKEVLGHTKAAIAYDNDDYGRGLRDAIVAKAAEIGLEIVDEQSWVREQTQDFKTLATALQAKAPQTVIIAGLYGEAALLAKAIRNDLGWKDVQLIGSDGVDNAQYISIGGDAAEGTLLTTPYFFSGEANPEAAAFGEAFRKKFEAEPGCWAALTYDAVGMALAGIKEVGTDRKKLKEWFASRLDPQTGYKGVTGVTYFDDQGDCPAKPAVVVQIQNGAKVLAPKQLN